MPAMTAMISSARPASRAMRLQRGRGRFPRYELPLPPAGGRAPPPPLPDRGGQSSPGPDGRDGRADARPAGGTEALPDWLPYGEVGADMKARLRTPRPFASS